MPGEMLALTHTNQYSPVKTDHADTGVLLPISFSHSLPCTPHTPPYQVFFIRDGLQFPDLVHCLRPNPKNNIQESWRILDFLSFHPESVNIVSGHCYDMTSPGVNLQIQLACKQVPAITGLMPPVASMHCNWP